jgi:DNA-binding IclR family transcriptional regulator
MYCTAAGRAILASLPEDELDFYLKTAELLPRTDHTVTSPDILKDKISLCRSCGYAEENQENEENIRCVGAAILSRRHYPLGAISITAPSFRFDNAKVLRYGPLIAETARELSALL